MYSTLNHPAGKCNYLSLCATVKRYPGWNLLQVWYRTDVVSQAVVFLPSTKYSRCASFRVELIVKHLATTNLALISSENLQPNSPHVHSPEASNVHLSGVFLNNWKISEVDLPQNLPEYCTLNCFRCPITLNCVKTAVSHFRAAMSQKNSERWWDKQGWNLGLKIFLILGNYQCS